MKTYSELVKLSTFDERFNYLYIGDRVCNETFGFDRYLNQSFYKSDKWRKFRRDIIIRDQGCDLGLFPFEIIGTTIIHHINPITKEDIINHSEQLMNPDNVICVSLPTHNAIHYGASNLYSNTFTDRVPGDTTLW